LDEIDTSIPCVSLASVAFCAVQQGVGEFVDAQKEMPPKSTYAISINLNNRVEMLLQWSGARLDRPLERLNENLMVGAYLAFIESPMAS
jgi:hypothetical protein